MTVGNLIAERGITEVLHFTTNKGVLGILATRALRARRRLGGDAQLEYIFTPNAQNRSRDMLWLDYANLSISRVNDYFFDISAGSWHRYEDIWWCVLAFDAEILEHDGVWFSTTNNIYPSVLRGQGERGLSQLFADPVEGKHQMQVRRTVGMPSNFTTCVQAEVLYPGEVSTNFLRNIYVSNDDDACELAAQCAAVGHVAVDIKVDSKHFTFLNRL